MAFDITSGERIWEAQAPNWVHSEMIFHENVLYVGFGNRFFQEPELRGRGDNGVLALNADTGETLWEYKTPGQVMPTPAYFKGHVYAATETSIYISLMRRPEMPFIRKR
ncbi:PQQ-binding-like beta-propeller repeat protein [Sinobaca sp. H24]|uniref:outer membrane protein assembly factor BamB family protein n=1 Tax=Sinobaca sp. H24 TaxID=2923376 RepID=UPI00207A2710|nr:PQQ-binding-like beta-propeller repeat protein [Sinobaca sp. H24]